MCVLPLDDLQSWLGKMHGSVEEGKLNVHKLGIMHIWLFHISHFQCDESEE